ncbi:MAG: hypothetical protein KGH75_12895, partial [Rhodospirillales bacterium]|nr:hypothetical protein [Rhodospirillales bacterium]
EVEQAIKSIQGISNAMDTAVDKFNKNAVPNGILTAEGMWTSRQLDVLTRIWRNLKMGQTKQWALPVIPIPKEGKLDLLDLTKLNGEDMRNVQFMNLMTGIFCAIFKFPIDRLGFHAAGAAPDNKPDVSNSPAAVRDETDAGLAPLLMTIENIINEYLLWPRWPHLCFSFSGKNPASDSREYEFKTNAMTWGERRAMADLPPLDVMGKDDEEKKMLRLISLAPTDSNLAGIYQNVLAAMYGKHTEGSGPEGKMTSKLDPAKSRDHGHEAGVRRDSAGEAASAES